MKNRGLLLAGASLFCLVVSCGDDAATITTTNPPQLVTFKATMTGGAENPANTSTATGTWTATLDTVSNILTYDFTFTGLTSNVNNGHIHAPAANCTGTVCTYAATSNVGTTVNFSTQAGATFTGFLTATSGTGHGTVLLTATNQIVAGTPGITGDSLKKLLFGGFAYANIHSVNNGGGEIRGQITKQ